MKNRSTYKTLTVFSVVPINRWYLGESAILRTITLNYFCFGWFSDLIHMGKTFDEAMAKRGHTKTN